MRKAASLTHQHILSVINSCLANLGDSVPIRILDVGCGDGKMISYLQHCLSECHPGLNVELVGLDVTDHGVQDAGYFDDTVQNLKEEHPNIAWEARLHAISSVDPWPFDAGSVDMIVSNNVLEHVDDHNRFFSEIQRCLREGGVSAHLFPVKEVINEGHLKIPLAHRFDSHDLRSSWIRMCSSLGLGKYSEHMRELGTTLDDYVSRHSDFLLHYTNYKKERELYAYAKSNRLRASFRHTSGYFSSKLRSMFGREPVYQYKQNPHALFSKISLLFLKRVAAVTLFLEKKETYRMEK